jgi:hypothetical protein
MGELVDDHLFFNLVHLHSKSLRVTTLFRILCLVGDIDDVLLVHK